MTKNKLFNIALIVHLRLIKSATFINRMCLSGQKDKKTDGVIQLFPLQGH